MRLHLVVFCLFTLLATLSVEFSPSEVELIRQLCEYFPTKKGLCRRFYSEPSRSQVPEELPQGVYEALEKYLGVGYNILNANPLIGNDMADTGFAFVQSRSPSGMSRVIDLKWQGLQSRYIHPSARSRCERCSLVDPTEVRVVSYQDYLKTIFDLTLIKRRNESSIDELRYAGDSDFTKLDVIKNQFKNKANVDLHIAYATCIVHCTSLKESPNDFPPLSQDFVHAVSQLPSQLPIKTEDIERRYKAFIEKFGTHVVTGMSLGSLSGLRVTVAKNEWLTMAQSGSLKSALLFRNKTIFGNIRPTYFSKGASIVPQNQTSQEWRKNSLKNPEPLEITLMPIAEMLTAKLMDVYDVASKQTALRTVFKNYCEYFIYSEEPEKCREFRVFTITDKAPIFGGAFQTSDCPNINNVNNYLQTSEQQGCNAGFTPVEIASIRWTSNFCTVKNWMCLHPEWKTVQRHNDIFGGMFIRTSSERLDEFNKRHSDGKCTPDCMKKVFGSRGELQSSGNPLNGNREQCPPSFKEYVYGKYYAWEYVICLQQSDMVSPSGFFGGGYQKYMSGLPSKGCQAKGNCHELDEGNKGVVGATTECPSSDYERVTVGHVGHYGYGFAEQYLCINEKQFAVIKQMAADAV